MARTNAATRSKAGGQATGMIVAATYTRNPALSRSTASNRTTA